MITRATTAQPLGVLGVLALILQTRVHWGAMCSVDRFIE